MLEALITSKTRLKLLIKFFVSAGNTGYLRGIAEEFDESTNSIRKELNQLTEAGFLERKQEQKKVLYRANITHPLFSPVQKLIHSFLGIDKVVDQVLERAGDIEQVSLLGDYARGVDSGLIEVLVTGKEIDEEYLMQVREKTEALIKKEIVLHFQRSEKDIQQIILYKKTNLKT